MFAHIRTGRAARQGIEIAMANGDDKSQATSSALVRKVLQVLDVLRDSPAGAVVYRQIEQILGDLEDAHLQTERTYAYLLYALLDAYAQHLPLTSPLHTQLKIVQQRIQPPLSGSDSLKAQFDVYADYIARLKTIDTARLSQSLAPFLSGAIHPDATLVTVSRDSEAIPAPRGYVEPEEGARQSKMREWKDSLTREIRATIAAHEEFGVMLEFATDELRQAGAMEQLEDVREHLLEQVKRLHDGHYALAEKLQSADRYLSVIETDSRQLNEELNRARILSLTDELTELPNRRAFMGRLEDEVGRVERYHAPLALAVIDLDRFKVINDQHGHAAGDQVLRCYAENIFSVFRHHDMVARYGGEEFAVILPNTGQEGAMSALHKIREQVSNLHCQGERFSIRLPSFSAGLAIYQDGETAESLIERADRALYQAKRLGRNRIEIAPAGPTGQESGQAVEAGCQSGES
jgi:diguanylate cyclase